MQRILFTDEDPPQDSIFALSLPQWTRLWLQMVTAGKARVLLV